MTTKISILGRCEFREFKLNVNRDMRGLGLYFWIIVPKRKKAILRFFLKWFEDSLKLAPGYKAEVVFVKRKKTTVFEDAFPFAQIDRGRKMEFEFIAMLLCA